MQKLKVTESYLFLSNDPTPPLHARTISQTTAPDTMTESGIWTPEEAQANHVFCPELAEAMLKILPKDVPVLDIGCGNGAYVDFLNERTRQGANGLEGTPSAHDKILCADLSKPFEYKWYSAFSIISLEVGEHIPREHEQTFLDNLVKYADRKVILSWAIPGQGGLGHVNERSFEYIVRQMVKRGFALNADETVQLRQAVATSSAWWFKNSIGVYDRA